MKKVILTSVTIFTLLTTMAQYKGGDRASSPAKAAFVEIGGPGLASLNYDMRFTKSESGIGGRIGVGGFSLGTASERVSIIFVPIGINYLLGKNEKNYFEVGGGITPVFASENVSGNSETFRSTFGHLNFGYRLQPKEGGFFFRAAINPVFGKGFFLPYYGGIGFGYKF